MAGAEILDLIHDHAANDLAKVTSPENGHLGSALEEDFGCLFGRDGAISTILDVYLLKNFNVIQISRPESDTSSLEYELLQHSKNTIRTLARSQGKFFDPWRDEEPGKIVHELREENGIPKNMAKLAELKAAGWPVDHGLRYYGSVDSTPLFIVAACEYIFRTGDLQFAEEIDENIRRAIDWIRYYGDKDGDLFIEFEAQNSNALKNQGWMDSGDSIKDENGLRPEGPHALVEVQGYQYMALKLASKLYKDKGGDYALELDQRAEALKVKFNREYWMKDEGFFAYDLDGEKRQLKDIRSNVGHLLMTGIIDEGRVPLVVKRLMQPDMFVEDGGIRTLSSESPNFSDTAPTGYHNGSIWPHDNAMIYLGLLECGYSEEAGRVKDAVLTAQKNFGDKYGEYDMELYTADKNGVLKLYETAQHPQGWVVNANLLWTAEYSQN